MKQRLDELLVERGLAPDLDAAHALIGAGEVLADETVADKAGQCFKVDVVLRVRERCRYVSRGGLKLEKGLSHFRLTVEGYSCLDVGASSGGFTDCLLQHGAAKVFAVDVAYGQLDWKLRQDPRVVVLERFNARKLMPHDLGEDLHFAVMDTSFISVTALIGPLLPLFGANQVRIMALIKPQFELPRNKVAKGGVVHDPKLHQEAIDKVARFATGLGLTCHGTVPSPILGPKGNREFLVYLTS